MPTTESGSPTDAYAVAGVQANQATTDAVAFDPFSTMTISNPSKSRERSGCGGFLRGSNRRRRLAMDQERPNQRRKRGVRAATGRMNRFCNAPSETSYLMFVTRLQRLTEN
jgi:hypothetical protein